MGVGPGRRALGPRYVLRGTASAPWAATAQQPLGELLGRDELGRLASRLVGASLSPTSYQSYGSALGQFVRFCAEEGTEPLDASLATVLRFTAWLARRGTVGASSLQPYYSAINRFLQDHLRQPVAHGPLLSAARRGLALQQVDTRPDPVRVALPAEAALAILRAAQAGLEGARWTCEGLPGLQLLRAQVMTVVNFLFLHRASTSTHCKTGDLVVDSRAVTLYPAFLKGKRRDPAGRKPVYTLPVRHQPEVAALLRAYILGREHLASSMRVAVPEMFWVLPGERVTPGAALVTQWLQVACASVGAAPPPGFTWSSHSLRKGGATAAYHAGVPLGTIRYLGAWAKHSAVVNDYIDFAAQNTPAGAFFFGWLTPAG